MWDLNVNIAADVAMEQPENFSGASPAAEEESGSSSSSVVNEAPSSADNPPGPGPVPADEESYSDASAAFIFDIMRKDEKAAAPGVVTRPFFPVVGNEAGLAAATAVGPSITVTPSRPQWLNLSFPDSGSSGAVGGSGGGHVELRAVQQIKKSRRGPRSRSSQYRGVTFYRRTGRWESHIWDCGKQVYLGGFDTAHAAARAYDRAAIKFRGVDADINFNVGDYDEDMAQMRNLNKEEFVQVLRRQSTGFSRGSSKFRGVTLHKCGRWEARTGQFLGKKAYDKAAVKYDGRDAAANFERSSYRGEILIETDARTEGGEHNLDLNLGISLPSKASHSLRQGACFRLGPCEVPNRGRPVVVGQHPSALAAALTRTSAPCSPAIHPNFFPRQEERRTTEISTQKSVAEALNSSARFSQWAWKTGGDVTNNSSPSGSVVTATPVFAAAASSGFSAAAALPRTSHANFVPTLCLPSLPSAVTEHFQSQIHRS